MKVNGWIINKMGKGKKNGWMDLVIKEIIKMGVSMERVFLFLMIMLSMLGILSLIKFMELGSIYDKMVKNIQAFFCFFYYLAKGNEVIIKFMEKEKWSGLMVGFMKENLLMIKKKELAFINGVVEGNIMATGKKINSMDWVYMFQLN